MRIVAPLFLLNLGVFNTEHFTICWDIFGFHEHSRTLLYWHSVEQARDLDTPLCTGQYA